MSDLDKQRATFIELVQGFCSRTYGSAPCTAALGTTGVRKCCNTESTCQDAVNYDGDPNALPFLSLPGVLGNVASTPDAPANQLTGDLDIRLKLALTDWTPATNNGLISKNQDAGSQVSYRLDVSNAAAGTLFFLWSPDGTIANRRSVQSSVIVGAADGSIKWVRVTLQCDDGAGNCVIKFYTSDDGITWVQLGTTATLAGTTSVFAGAQPVVIGQINGNVFPLNGNVYYAELRDGIDGPVVVKFDPPYNESAYNAASFVSETGERWSISTSGGTPAKLVGKALKLRFTQPQNNMDKYDPSIPALGHVQITPAQLNLAAMERNAGALGQREVCTAQVNDFQHSDLIVDRYRLERISGAASLLDSGTAQAGADFTLTLRAAASSVDNFYRGMYIRLTDGTGREGLCSKYDGTTKIATISTHWPTNLFQWSEQVNQAGAWALSAVTISTDLIASPIDGAISVDKMTETATTADHGVVSAVNPPAAVNERWSVSYHVKAAERTLFYIWMDNGSGFGITYKLDTVNRTMVQTRSGTGGYINIDAGFVEVQPGFFRFWITATVVNALITNIQSRCYLGVTGIPNNGFGSESYLGDITKGGYVTASSISKLDITTYVKTVGATVVLPGAATTYEIREKYDPYKVGTFWGKWLARNPFYANFSMTLREGIVGDLLSAMRIRNYAIDRVEGPTGGVVNLIAKDFFTKIESRKAVAPLASNGRATAGVTAAAGQTITLLPAGIGNLEYAAAGFVVIGDEECGFTRAADVITLTTRGQNGTTAAAHTAEDLVQTVLVITTQLAKDIVYTLLSGYTELMASQLPLAEWTTAMVALTEVYSAHITAPTPVLDLIGELSEQAGFTVFPNTATGKIKMVPLRSAVSTVNIYDDVDMIGDSMSVKRQDSRRVSQVWVYYGQRNVTKKIDEDSNFYSRAISANLGSENQHGTATIKKVYSRWIAQFGRTFALATGARILEMFKDPPIETHFRVLADEWDNRLQLAQFVSPVLDDIQDATGNRLMTTQAILSIERDDDQLEIVAQEVVLTPANPAAERVIYIDNDTQDLNLRAVHDLLYAPPVGTETVRFFISPGVVVKASSTAANAVDTGDWPAGVVLTLENQGRVLGKGGRGGKGANSFVNGSNGTAGGNALKVRFLLSVINALGEIWGGGGGGGGGPASNVPLIGQLGGGGGGGGTGFGDAGGPGTGGSNETTPAKAGSVGTKDGGGKPGLGGYFTAVPGLTGGKGGKGGSPGAAGLVGVAGNVGGGTSTTPGTGGGAGTYVNGNSFVTWVSNGSRLGGVV